MTQRHIQLLGTCSGLTIPLPNEIAAKLSSCVWEVYLQSICIIKYLGEQPLPLPPPAQVVALSINLVQKHITPRFGAVPSVTETVLGQFIVENNKKSQNFIFPLLYFEINNPDTYLRVQLINCQTQMPLTSLHEFSVLLFIRQRK